YEMMMKMYVAGMNVVRLNMSHGTHDTHEQVIRSVKNINQRIKDSIPILMDLEGPEIRTGSMDNDIHLNEGDIITVSVGNQEAEISSFSINYEDLINTLNEGDKITVDSGLINLEILKKNRGTMECKVLDGGMLKSQSHVNLPGIRVNLPSITEHDKRHVEFGLEQNVDFIALSFVRQASDVEELKRILGDKVGKIKIISKIEDQEGVANIDEIIDASDAVMVARGDLGVEVELQDLPNIQRTIVRKCHEKGKRVIVATHLLESMIEKPLPTRAEVTDVANAVYSEVDAVMLSGETAVGKYPIRCIENIHKIATASEQLPGMNFSRNLQNHDDKQSVAASAISLAESIEAKGILVITRRGIMAQYLTNCRPTKTYIYAFTNDNRTRRQLFLNRSVIAHRIEFSKDPEKTIQNAITILRMREGFLPGDRVVVLSDIIAGAGIDAIQIRAIE
ncbi:MAG: pyruvate kinase, partial [Thermodesulfobacteriota bacterium]